MFQEKLSILLQDNKWQIVLALAGLLLIGGGILTSKVNLISSNKVEIITPSGSPQGSEIIVEIAGQVNKPGVYHLPPNSRIEDLLRDSGGLTDDASKDWVAKNLNRAAKLIDGQKLYIPKTNEQTSVLSASDSTNGSTISNSVSDNLSKTININTASASQLDILSGIGPVYAQKIIDNRPYSSIEELVSKKVISQKIFDKNKELISVY